MTLYLIKGGCDFLLGFHLEEYLALYIGSRGGFVLFAGFARGDALCVLYMLEVLQVLEVMCCALLCLSIASCSRCDGG